MLQLEAGLRLQGTQGTVAHVIDVLDEAYAAAEARPWAAEDTSPATGAEKEPG
jgi:hypothetical protein